MDWSTCKQTSIKLSDSINAEPLISLIYTGTAAACILLGKRTELISRTCADKTILLTSCFSKFGIVAHLTASLH